jgi:hypothetical protein
VSRYLAANGWERTGCDPGVRELWEIPDTAQLMLPLATDYLDFGRRFQDALRTLVTVNDWDAAQLAATLLPYNNA